MFNNRSTDIAVLGAGPVGLAASHGLLANGVEHCLFEQAGGVHSHSYALALHPDTMRRLHDLNLSKPILAHALKVDKIAIYDGSRRRAVLDCGKLAVDFPYLTVIGQNHLEEILATALEQRHHAPMWHHRGRFEANFEDSMRLQVDRLYTGMTGYAVAHFATQVDKTFRYDVNYVLGTDGHESSVRRAAGIDYVKQGPPVEYAVFEFKAEGEVPDELRFVIQDGKTHIYWPLQDGHCRWSFQLSRGHLFPGMREQTQAMVQKGMQSFPLLDRCHLETMLVEHAPWFDARPGAFRWRTVVKFESRLADSFGHGRLWIAGDAAHMGPPAGMLSMNHGICEALDMVECIVRGRDDEEREDALAEVAEKWRKRWTQSFHLEPLMRMVPESHEWLREHVHHLAGNLPVSPDQIPVLLQEAEISH